MAVVTNITPDHLDRHATMEEYVAAKANILRFQHESDVAVLNADDPASSGLWPLCRGRVLSFGLTSPVERGACLKGENLVLRGDGKETTVCRASDLHLLGRHNTANALAAVSAAAACGVAPEAMAATLHTFRGLEHRLEFVAEIEEVRYYNDSIATTPERTIAALQSFESPIILLAGGKGKNLPLERLAGEIMHRCKEVILFGRAAPQLEQAIESHEIKVGHPSPLVLNAVSLEEALVLAKQGARPGDVVLLSPAFTSFDMFRDYAERGKVFKNQVQKLLCRGNCFRDEQAPKWAHQSAAPQGGEAK